MKRIALFGVLALEALTLVACATAPVPPLSAAAREVRTGKSDPPSDMREIGPIEATSGSGRCGAVGERGSYEGAVAELRNKGAAMGATYVQIFTMSEPHREPDCNVKTFVIRGTAYGPK